jgi:serine/threonine protein kinase/beta-lactam-binding protein with PASTA domain
VSGESRALSGRYRVDELIGRGGMAAVYRGYDITLGRDVAIKILKADLAQNAAFRTRFRLEAKAASRMSHPDIVRVFDAGEDVAESADGTTRPLPYIVMELVQGRLLKDVIAAGPVPIADALRYADGILEALEYSHRAGVVHRDIKPGNVMITDAGEVKVMDFGIARAVSDSSSTVADTTAIIGTAAYFSPEQAKGEAVDARADLYSAGVVLYELLTGRQPFRGETPVAVAYQHVSEAPEPPSELIDTIPRGLDAVVLRALAKDPFQRFPDAASFRSALRDVESATTSKRQIDALTSELYGPNPRHAAETARALRQLSTDTTMRRTQSGPPATWVWAGIAVLAALLIAVMVWVVTIPHGGFVPSGAQVVPDVTGMSWDQANKKLADSDLIAQRVYRSSSSVAKGKVVETDPGKGVSVADKQRIQVFVSSGSDAVAVPKLAGLTQSQAEQALNDAGLVLGPVQQQDNPDTAAGIVLQGGSPAGAKVPKGSTVGLIVATGTVAIVDFTAGYTLDDAVSALQSLKLTAVTQDDPSCAAANPRTVTSQSAAPGEVPIHSTVTLVSCSGG